MLLGRHYNAKRGVVEFGYADNALGEEKYSGRRFDPEPENMKIGVFPDASSYK